MQVPANADSVITTTAKGMQYTLGELIDAVKVLPNTGIWVAVTIGLMLLLIGWFGGTKHNLWQIFFSMVMGSLVAFFGLPVPIWLLDVLLKAKFIPPPVALLLVFLLWLLFIMAIVISLYETWIVTIKEQFGSGR